jgi:perosamine synthetase
LYERVLTLSNHGRARGQTKQFWSDFVGFKYKMSNLQAAIGCAQMNRIHDLIGRKCEIMDAYRVRLSGLSCLSMNLELEGSKIGAWMPTAVFTLESGITREKLQAAFAAENIDARVFFWPLSSMSMFTPIQSNFHAYAIPNRAINLPSFHDITTEELDRVSGVLLQLVA